MKTVIFALLAFPIAGISQPFFEAQIGGALPSFKVNANVSAGYRFGVFEPSAISTHYFGYATNVGAVAAIRLNSSFSHIDERDGWAIGIGAAKSWYHVSDKSDLPNFTPVVSVKREMSTGKNWSMLGEIRYQQRIISLNVGVRL